MLTGIKVAGLRVIHVRPRSFGICSKMDAQGNPTYPRTDSTLTPGIVQPRVAQEVCIVRVVISSAMMTATGILTLRFSPSVLWRLQVWILNNESSLRSSSNVLNLQVKPWKKYQGLKQLAMLDASVQISTIFKARTQSTAFHTSRRYD